MCESKVWNIFDVVFKRSVTSQVTQHECYCQPSVIMNHGDLLYFKFFLIDILF